MSIRSLTAIALSIATAAITPTVVPMIVGRDHAFVPQPHLGPSQRISTSRRPLTLRRFRCPQAAPQATTVSLIAEATIPPAAIRMHPSILAHVLRLNGREATVTLPGSLRVSALQLMTDTSFSSKHLGESYLVPTREGIRFPTAPNSLRSPPAHESHRDQCLATLAEIGVALSHECFVNGRREAVAGILNDSIANFHLKQRELEWTAVAYAIYLPPQANWTNRFGEQVSFDELSAELCSRPLSQASCGGSHILFSLAALLQADNQRGVLSVPVRHRVEEYVSSIARTIVRNQEGDGSWSPNWCRRIPGVPVEGAWADETINARLLVTGHLLELLSYLPQELDIPDDVLKAAATWLRAQLDGVDSERFWTDICPITHSVCAIRAGVPGQTPGQRVAVP